MAKLLLLALLAILPLPTVHGQGTPLLFLGPGYYSDESAVFSLPVQGGSLSTSSCTVPDYPVTDMDIYGYVAFVKDGYLQLCGGLSSTGAGYQSSCYALRDSAWVATTPLTSTRFEAAATTLHSGHVLISGGMTAYKTYLSSSEIWTGTTWAPALELPSARSGHCMLALSTGAIFLHGGRSIESGYGYDRDTYLSTDLTSWQTKASSGNKWYNHACAEVTLDTEQEVWVGSRGTSEIYSVATDTWRTGPSLHNGNGEFVSYNDQLYYAAGNSKIYQLKAGWKQLDTGGWMTRGDGWEKIGKVSGYRTYFQAVIISQDICEGLGEKTKGTPLELTFTPDGSVGYVSGSLVPVLTELASASPEPLPVSCCGGATTTATTCGNGTSCTNICGGDSSGCITLVLEEAAADDQVCHASMDQQQWCGNADTIQGLTNRCSRKRRSARTKRAAFGVTTTILHINYCPFRVWNIGSLKKYPNCCLHPNTRRIHGVPKACCTDHKACF